MHTDRRIYWTTAIVALVIALAISFIARSDPLASVVSGDAAASILTSAQGGDGLALHEVQSASSKVDAVDIIYTAL